MNVDGNCSGLHGSLRVVGPQGRTNRERADEMDPAVQRMTLAV